tara:strand:- start:966 stop:1604 length:639 start_codon:yes stop_codon:yes gene_type:complete
MISYARLTVILNGVVLLVCLFFMKAVSAGETNLCEYHHALKHGFDMTAYRHCETAIKSCPSAGLFLDKKCVSAQLSKQFCQQLSSLAEILKVDAEMILIKSTDHYAMISVHYPADGALQYYLLSPKGCLLNTSLDPSTVDNTFKHHYAKHDLYIEANKPPSYEVLPDGQKRFIVNIEGRDSCRACAVVVTAKLGFNFNTSDELDKVSLISYR